VTDEVRRRLPQLDRRALGLLGEELVVQSCHFSIRSDVVLLEALLQDCVFVQEGSDLLTENVDYIIKMAVIEGGSLTQFVLVFLV
jgi:hypothetical protein